MIRYFLSLSSTYRHAQLSQRALSLKTRISRGCLRQIEQQSGNSEISSLEKLADFLGQEIELLFVPSHVLAEFSTIAVALKVEHDGFKSWKVHFFDLVDEFRRTLDPRLILLPPHEKFEPRLKALLASIVRDLCAEIRMPAPRWSEKSYFLPSPWFVAELESLKASAILESPLPYRSNNIFVNENFLKRV